MRTCTGACQQSKPLDAFGIRSRAKGTYQPWCKACVNAHNKARYASDPARRASIEQRRLEQVASNRALLLAHLHTHPCVDCGHADVLSLEFDHVRGVKTEPVTTMAAKGSSTATLQAEIAKCDVRCGNCHRRRSGATGRWWKDLYLLA